MKHSSAKYYPTSLGNPVDGTAARVIRGGTHHEFKKVESQEIWDTPPPTLPMPEPIKHLLNSRKGRLVVIGYLGNGQNKKKSRRAACLLVRCDCGRYESRLAKKWTVVVSVYDYCQICAQMEKLKVSHLPYQERDRLENIARRKLGLPEKIKSTNENS